MFGLEGAGGVSTINLHNRLIEFNSFMKSYVEKYVSKQEMTPLISKQMKLAADTARTVELIECKRL